MNAPAKVWVVVRSDGLLVDVGTNQSDVENVASGLARLRATRAEPLQYKSVRYVRAEGEA